MLNQLLRQLKRLSLESERRILMIKLEKLTSSTLRGNHESVKVAKLSKEAPSAHPAMFQSEINQNESIAKMQNKLMKRLSESLMKRNMTLNTEILGLIFWNFYQESARLIVI